MNTLLEIESKRLKFMAKFGTTKDELMPNRVKLGCIAYNSLVKQLLAYHNPSTLDDDCKMIWGMVIEIDPANPLTVEVGYMM